MGAAADGSETFQRRDDQRHSAAARRHEFCSRTRRRTEAGLQEGQRLRQEDVRTSAISNARPDLQSTGSATHEEVTVPVDIDAGSIYGGSEAEKAKAALPFGDRRSNR